MVSIRNARHPGPQPKAWQPEAAVAAEGSSRRESEDLHRHIMNRLRIKRVTQTAFLAVAGLDRSALRALRDGVQPRPETRAKLQHSLDWLERQR